MWFTGHLGPEFRTIQIAQSRDDQDDFDLKLFQNFNFSLLATDFVRNSSTPTKAELEAVTRMLFNNIKSQFRINYRP